MKRQRKLHTRLILIGDACVGKTSLLNRYALDTFDRSEVCTIGLQFNWKVQQEVLPGLPVSVQVADTTDPHRYQGVIESYFPACNGFMLVYSVSDRTSFHDIDSLLELILRENISRRTTTTETDHLLPVVILVGNKNDAETRREVSYEEGEALARQIAARLEECRALWGQKAVQGGGHRCGASSDVSRGESGDDTMRAHVPFFETSALDNTNVDLVFTTLARNSLPEWVEGALADQLPVLWHTFASTILLGSKLRAYHATIDGRRGGDVGDDSGAAAAPTLPAPLKPFVLGAFPDCVLSKLNGNGPEFAQQFKRKIADYAGVKYKGGIAAAMARILAARKQPPPPPAPAPEQLVGGELGVTCGGRGGVAPSCCLS